MFSTDLSLNHLAKDHQETCDISDTMEERRVLRLTNPDPVPMEERQDLQLIKRDPDTMQVQRTQRAQWVNSGRDRLEEGRAQYIVNSDRLETARIQLPANMDYHVIYNELWTLSTTAGMFIDQIKRINTHPSFDDLTPLARQNWIASIERKLTCANERFEAIWKEYMEALFQVAHVTMDVSGSQEASQAEPKKSGFRTEAPDADKAEGSKKTGFRGFFGRLSGRS